VKILRLVSAISGWTAFVGVVIYVACIRLIGEGLWLTTVCLYLPQAALLVPLAGASVLLLAFGPRRLLLAQLVAALAVLFLLMGLHVSGPSAPGPGPKLRVMSYNVMSGNGSVEDIVAEVRDAAPDIVLLQESDPRVNDDVADALPGFHTGASGQFRSSMRRRRSASSTRRASSATPSNPASA
jgi:endonuclease/exonuclease/phosphatase (EEP) superfamily protein YafD